MSVQRLIATIKYWFWYALSDGICEYTAKKPKERTLVEGIAGTWYYHLSDDGRTALCGAAVMISSAPESTWGYKSGHLNERYCSKCEAIRNAKV
jgi:hypothetical protein